MQIQGKFTVFVLGGLDGFDLIFHPSAELPIVSRHMPTRAMIERYLRFTLGIKVSDSKIELMIDDGEAIEVSLSRSRYEDFSRRLD